MTALSTLTSGISTINNEIGQANGIASLDADGKLNTNQIPSLAIDTVTTVQTIADRDNLTNIDTGDIVLVINDTSSSNNGSYIYNGSGYSALALYNNVTMLSNLTDCSISTPSNNQV